MYAGHYSERDASTLMWKITDALVHCHSKEICHRDLKPEVCVCVCLCVGRVKRKEAVT